MPVDLDLSKPETINFYIESIEKTAYLRMKWNQANAEKIQQCATWRREERGLFEEDILKSSMEACMPATTRDHVNAARHKFTRPTKPYVLNLADLQNISTVPPDEDPRLDRPDSDLSPDPLMRPVDPNIKKIIFKDKPVDGRVTYLKTRSKVEPESKYYFPECSSWVYGWRIHGSSFGKNAPEFGNTCKLTRGIKSRTGPHPDPQHYYSSEIPGPTKLDQL